MKNTHRILNSRSGATTVEFAFVVPIIFTMFLGAIELTRMNFIRQTAANAAYEGARKAIVPGNSASDAQTEAFRLLTNLGVRNGAGVVVNSTISRVTVTVTIPINQNSWGLTRFTGGFSVTQSCSLTLESLH